MSLIVAGRWAVGMVLGGLGGGMIVDLVLWGCGMARGWALLAAVLVGGMVGAWCSR